MWLPGRTVARVSPGPGSRRQCDSQGELRASERSGEGDCASGPALDSGQLAGGPVAGDFAELHPDEVVVRGVQTFDDLPEDLEARFFSVEVHARPVADHDGGLAAGDHFRQPAVLQVGRDELVDRAGREPVPAAEPVARAADDRDHALGVRAVQACASSTRGATLCSSVKRCRK